MHVTVVYNGAGHPYDFNEGATLAAVFLFLKNGLNLPKLDLMRFAMGNIDVDDSPADILVSHVFSENATLSITNKSQLEGNTVRISLFTIDAVPLHSNPYSFKHMRVTVVYKGTSHAYDFNKGAPLRAVFLWMKDQLGLPDTRMRYAIAGRDSIDVGELPGDALVSSVFFENAVLSITDKPLLEGNTVRISLFTIDAVPSQSNSYSPSTCVLRWFTTVIVILMTLGKAQLWLKCFSYWRMNSICQNLTQCVSLWTTLTWTKCLAISLCQTYSLKMRL